MLSSSKYMAIRWLPSTLIRVSILVPFLSCARVLPRGPGTVGLEHRSGIAPSPLAGEGWDGGAEAGTDSERHAWPHPSRGRELAGTGSPNDDLTDVLGVRGAVAAVCVEVFGGECCRSGGGGSCPCCARPPWSVRPWAAHCGRSLIGKGAAVRPCSCEKLSTPVLSTQSSPQQ
jgi:hypothetical protein